MQPTADAVSETASDAPSLSTYFYIAGRGFDEDGCTSAIGLQPTEIWRQKREDLKQRNDLPTISWNIGREARRLYSVSEAVDEVLDLVWAARERIRNYVRGKDLEVGVACTVTIREDRPVFDLSQSTIRRLAALSCEFSLDIIDYSD